MLVTFHVVQEWEEVKVGYRTTGKLARGWQNEGGFL
jgi:hypothetical protein